MLTVLLVTSQTLNWILDRCFIYCVSNQNQQYVIILYMVLWETTYCKSKHYGALQIWVHLAQLFLPAKKKQVPKKFVWKLDFFLFLNNHSVKFWILKMCAYIYTAVWFLVFFHSFAQVNRTGNHEDSAK